MKQHRRFLVILGLTAAAVLVPASIAPASVELVVNGDFESGDFTDWTHTLGTVSAVSGGGYEAVFGGPGLGGIEQNIATTQGEKYLLSFQLGNVDISPSTWSDFRVSWGGQVLYDGGMSPMPMTSWSYEVTGGAGETTNLKFDLYRHTLYGDANRDGTVNFTDLNIVVTYYNQPGDWAKGDFNNDGRVNFTDLNTVVTYYNQSLETTTKFDEFGLDNVSIYYIPEPATIIVWSLLGMAAAGYGVWRRCDRVVLREERQGVFRAP